MLGSVVVAPLLIWVAQRRSPWWGRPIARRIAGSAIVVDRVTARVRRSLHVLAFAGLAIGAILRLYGS